MIFFGKAEAAAAELFQRGPLIKNEAEVDDLATPMQIDAKRLRWFAKRLQRSLDAGTERWDLYMALASGMAMVNAWQHLDELAPPDKRARKITPKRCFEAIREFQPNGKKVTQENIAREFRVYPQKLRE